MVWQSGKETLYINIPYVLEDWVLWLKIGLVDRTSCINYIDDLNPSTFKVWILILVYINIKFIHILCRQGYYNNYHNFPYYLCNY